MKTERPDHTPEEPVKFEKATKLDWLILWAILLGVPLAIFKIFAWLGL